MAFQLHHECSKFSGVQCPHITNEYRCQQCQPGPQWGEEKGQRAVSHMKKVARINLPHVQEKRKQVNGYNLPVFPLVEMRLEAVTKAPLQQAPTHVSHQGDVKKYQLEKETEHQLTTTPYEGSSLIIVASTNRSLVRCPTAFSQRMG